MNEAELMYECQVCYKLHRGSKLISVEAIEYSHWQRVFPWFICQECAEKVRKALEKKEGKYADS